MERWHGEVALTDTSFRPAWAWRNQEGLGGLLCNRPPDTLVHKTLVRGGTPLHWVSQWVATAGEGPDVEQGLVGPPGSDVAQAAGV